MTAHVEVVRKYLTPFSRPEMTASLKDVKWPYDRDGRYPNTHLPFFSFRE